MTALEDLTDSNAVSASIYDDEEGLLPLADPLTALQHDAGFLLALHQSPEVNAIPTLEYFLANAARILETDYIPTDEDVIRCRVSTLAVGRERIPYDDANELKLLDFGGYRH